MENIFDVILDRDERVAKVFKPVKAKYFTRHYLCLVLVLLVFAVPFMAGYATGEMPPVAIIIVSCAAALAVAIFSVCVCVYYKNLFYCYTNKRIIIRSGIVGVDFKALDMNMVGATKVKVSLIDKLCGKNTGTLTFGSMASPMMTTENGSSGGYVLCDIQNPYEVYRELKEQIENKKNPSLNN